MSFEDFRVSRNLRFNPISPTVSGHAARLKHVPFPTITEEEIFTAITSPTIEVKRKVVPDPGTDHTCVDKFVEIHQDAVCTPEVAKFILRKLGNNLAQIDECLGRVVEKDGVRIVVARMGMAEVESKLRKCEAFYERGCD